MHTWREEIVVAKQSNLVDTTNKCIEKISEIIIAS
jgi:hypothetical protein